MNADRKHRRLGVPGSQLEPLRQFGLRFKFYLNYGDKALDHDDYWHVYYPRTLEASSLKKSKSINKTLSSG